MNYKTFDLRTTPVMTTTSVASGAAYLLVSKDKKRVEEKNYSYKHFYIQAIDNFNGWMRQLEVVKCVMKQKNP